MVAKKASSKKTAKKTTKKKAKASAAAAKVKLDFALDPSKLAAIQKCLAKGRLAVTVNRVSLGKAKIRDPWLYD